MKKVTMGPQTMLYPMAVVLVGANVDDKPNFMAAAWCCIASAEPPMITVGIRHSRYTLKGVMKNLAFSVNVPSCNLVAETDYCGIESGSKVDKVKDCQFKVFYGKSGDVPLIEQCPLNLECTVKHILDLGSHVLIVGSIDETYISEDCLTDGKPDIEKIDPFAYLRLPARQYRAMGKVIGKAYGAGTKIKPSL